MKKSILLFVFAAFSFLILMNACKNETQTAATDDLVEMEEEEEERGFVGRCWLE